MCPPVFPIIPSQDPVEERILDAAERLFAAQGIEPVSLWDIVLEARVDEWAIHHYFGTKRLLIKGVFLRRLAPLNQRWVELFDELERKCPNGRPGLEEVLWTLIYPVVEQGMQDRNNMVFFKLMARGMSEVNEEIRHLLRTEYAPFLARMDAMLLRSVPELAPENLTWVIKFVMGAIDISLTVLIAENRSQRPLSPGQTPIEELMDRIVTFTIGGLHAMVQKYKD